MKAPKRKPPNLKEKLAATLLQMVRPNDRGLMVRVIDHNSAKGMSPEAIIAKFHFDHVVFHAFDGTTHPSNLVPRPVAEHRAKTAKRDIPAIAKVKRSIKERKFEVQKTPELEVARSKPKWQSKPMPGTKASGWKKPLHGAAIKRQPAGRPK